MEIKQTESQQTTPQEPQGEICPYCQTPNLIPTSGGKMKCKRCGFCDS